MSRASDLRARDTLAQVVVEVPLHVVREHRDELYAEHFTPREVAELRGRHPQSTAGALAVKRALCQLAARLYPAQCFLERDFVLGHDDRGAPQLLELGPEVPIPRECLAISITHTRQRAWGLAVCALDGVDAEATLKSSTGASTSTSTNPKWSSNVSPLQPIFFGKVPPP